MRVLSEFNVKGPAYDYRITVFDPYPENHPQHGQHGTMIRRLADDGTTITAQIYAAFKEVTVDNILDRIKTWEAHSL